MTSSVSSSAEVPAWDTTPTITTTTNPARTVPDDWDADDPNEEESAKDVWNRANAAAPMPQIQLSNQQSMILPPVSAIMPSMRILQRPKSSSPSQSGSGSGTPGNGAKTMKEREAEYKAARDRIFANSGGGDGSGPSSREASPAPKRGILTRGRGGGQGGQRRGSPNSVDGPKTVREPLGPSQEGRGFAPRGRRGRGGAPKEPVQDQ